MDVELPNGMIIEGVPEGVDRDTLRKKLIASGVVDPSVFPDPPPPEAPTLSAPRALAGGAEATMTPAPVSGVSGFGMGLRDPIDAAAQLLERGVRSIPLVGEGTANLLNDVNDTLLGGTRFGESLGSAGLQGMLNRQEADYQAAREAEGETGVDWDRLGGNVVSGILSGVPAGALLSGLAPASAAARVGAGAALGGIEGGLLSEPLTGGREENFWQEKGKQAALGAGTGGLLSGLGSAAAGARNRATSPDVVRLREAGVEPTVGQTLGGTAGRIEEKLASVPLVGDAVRHARQRAKEEFNLGALNEALAPLGRTVDDVGQEGIDQARVVLDDAYTNAAKLLPSEGVRIDDEAIDSAVNIFDRLEGASQEAADTFSRFYRNTYERMAGPNGTLDASQFKRLDSQIGANRRSSKGELKEAFTELQNTLRAAAGRASPDYREATRAADEAFARMVRVENAAGRAINAENRLFSPAQLNMAARTGDSSARRGATARGAALMQDYASAGQQVLGDRVPNSGTVDRLLGGGGAVGAGALGGALLGDMVLGAGLMAAPILGASRVAQRAATAGLRKIPRTPLPHGLLGGVAGAPAARVLGGEEHERVELPNGEEGIIVPGSLLGYQ